MDVPVPAPSQCVVGLTIPLPEPWATQVRLVRAACRPADEGECGRWARGG